MIAILPIAFALVLSVATYFYLKGSIDDLRPAEKHESNSEETVIEQTDAVYVDDETAVLVLSCAFFGAQLYMGATQMEEGTRQSDLFASGTYQYDFQAPFEQMFGYLPSTYVQRSAAFEDPAVQVALQMGARSHSQARLVAKSQVGVGTGSSWVASVAAQGTPDCTGANTVKIKTQPQNMCALDASDAATETEYAYSPAAEFYPRFAAYLGGTGALSAGSFVCKRTSAAAATRAGCEAGGGTFVGSKFGAYCRVSCFEVGAAWAAGGPRDVVLHAARSSVSVDGLTSIDRYKEGIRTCREQVDPCSSAYSTGAIGALPSWAASNGTTPGAVDPGFWAYPTGYFYQYYDQYLYIAKLLKEALLLGIAGIFVASFLFTLSWRSSLCLMICVTFSVVELIGVIPESSLTLEDPGLRLNAFSLVNIIACIGMAVEFTAHILHQFIAEPNAASSPGEDRQRRVIHAMTFMGPPIVHGVVTTLISTAFLATNDMRFIFEYYFFMFFVMVLIASFNGLVLLPVLLSLIGEGPMALDEDHATDVKKSPGRKSMQMVVLGAGVDDLPPRSPGAAPGPYYAAHVF